jgi:hypothetical protein
MTCPNPECGIEMDPSWRGDVVFRDVVPGQTFRYFECQRCHQFVVVEL